MLKKWIIFGNYCSIVVDSWGKVPAAWFSGNSYDFGGFAECFNIERNGESYKTQYCLGHLVFDLKKFDDDFTQFHVNQNSENTEDMLITPFVVVPK